MKGRRILSALGAAWMLLSLATPAFAKQVNTETKEQEKRYGDYYYDGADSGDPVGHVTVGDPFWSEQPFDSYWTDRGHSNYAGHGRSGMWLMTNYYYSGEGSNLEKGSYLGMRTVMGCRVFTEAQEWNLDRVSDKTDGTFHEIVYVGEVYTGDTIETICTDYNMCMAYATNRYDNWQAAKNDPSCPPEVINKPTEYSCFNSNVRAVQRNGVWSDDAEDFIWEQNPKADANGEYFTGDAAMCGWLYTVQPGDEVIYADCQARHRYKNEYNGVEYDAITIRYRFKFVVMDSGADVTLPLNNQTSTPQEPDDEDSWWDDLFGGDDGDTGSSDYLPPEPSKPESGLPEGETISEKGAAVIGTAAGAAIIGGAVGGMAGGGTDGGGETVTKQPDATGPDPEEERRRAEELRRQQEEERKRQEEEQKRLEEERQRDEDLKRLREELAEQKRQLKELEQKIIEDARKKAEEQKKYIDKLYKKYGVDPDQKNAKKILRNTIKKEQIKNANDAAAELAKDAELAVWEQLAKDISNWSDVALETLSAITGPEGKAILDQYQMTKATLARTAEAVARIAYNGKSYADYSAGDYLKDAWDIAHSTVQGAAEGVKTVAEGRLEGKAKYTLMVAGESAKEMWETARNGGDMVDILKGGIKGGVRGGVNAGISYATDKVTGKVFAKVGLSGKEVIDHTNISRPKNFENAMKGVKDTISIKVTSKNAADSVTNLVTGSTKMATDFDENLGNTLDSLFGKQTSHADAAAKAAQRASDAAKSYH